MDEPAPTKTNCTKPNANQGYVETDFRYLAIGSPVPNAETSQDTSDNEYDADIDLDSGDEDSDTHRNKNKKTFFGHDFKGQQQPSTTKNCSRRKKVADNPTIRVDTCRAGPGDLISDEGTSSESSYTGSASYDCVSMHSSLQGQAFLSPTPPLGRKSNVNSKTVIYYSPSLTCSRSESSLLENTVGDPCSLDYDPCGIGAAHSLSVLRSPSKAEVSVANRNVLLSPISFRKDRPSGSISGDKNSLTVSDGIGGSLCGMTSLKYQNTDGSHS